MNKLRLYLPLVLLVSVVIMLACGEQIQTPVSDQSPPQCAELDSAMSVASDKDQAILLDFYTDW